MIEHIQEFYYFIMFYFSVRSNCINQNYTLDLALMFYEGKVLELIAWLKVITKILKFCIIDTVLLMNRDWTLYAQVAAIVFI